MHQMIILEQLKNPNLDDCNICEHLHTISVLIEQKFIARFKDL